MPFACQSGGQPRAAAVSVLGDRVSYEVTNLGEARLLTNQRSVEAATGNDEPSSPSCNSDSSEVLRPCAGLRRQWGLGRIPSAGQPEHARARVEQASIFLPALREVGRGQRPGPGGVQRLGYGGSGYCWLLKESREVLPGALSCSAELVASATLALARTQEMRGMTCKQAHHLRGTARLGLKVT